MARNLDKIQLPTNITDIAMLSILLRAVKENEPLTPQDSKTIFEEAKKDGKRKKKSKGDTHTEKALYTYGLIKYVGADKKSFVVTNLGEELLSIYNENGALLCDESTFVKITLKVFSAWHADNKGRNIHPGQIILQLLCDADLNGYLTEHEVAQMVYNPAFKLDSQYDEIKAFLLAFRSNQLASPYTKTTKSYIFLPSLVNNWHILEKESVDSLNILSDGQVVIGGDMLSENDIVDENDDISSEDNLEDTDDEVDVTIVTKDNLYGTLTKYRLTNLAKKIICDRVTMFTSSISAIEENVDVTSNMFSPEWFREKAKEYPSLDEEANQLLADFQTKFAPDVLASLSGVEMLNTIFLNAANAENVCRVLEFGPQIKDTFGSIKGGNAYKYGLYYSAQGVWMTGSHQKPRQLTEDEAIEVGSKLRDHLVEGANAIKEYGPLATIDDYKKLHQILHEVTEGDIERVWFLKYYQMLYPELFATNYSDYAQRTVLGAIGEEKEKYPFVRMGQIRFYANKCGISNVMFNKIFWDYYSEEATVAKGEPSQDICYSTGYQNDYSRNRILFGAPGTGKSFTLNHEKDLLLAEGGEYERVTFHPDYSYANFVGTYKPVPCKDDQGHDAITYAYVPGPFMRTYVKALQNSRTDAPKPFLLVIEEINRANVAAVFGDVFQLLDRGDDEVSEYPIQASEDIKKYLSRELGGNPDDYSEIRIPDNMFIWATMNSADQGVFPMDTAFKRRWDFTYLGIDDSEAGIVGKKVVLGQGEYCRVVEWNALRKAINSELLTYKVNEDKLMGPYFISKKNLPEGDTIDPAMFTRIFKNKVLMYLFDDAAKQKRPSLFAGCKDENKNLYSQICREFDTKGVFIFCTKISDCFLPEDDGE